MIMWPCMKLRHLQSVLQDLQVFEKPKLILEQYPTPPHLASHVLHTIQSQHGDIQGKLVADLGCGCGGLTFGASALGAGLVIGFEIDIDALEIFNFNQELCDAGNVEAINCDVLDETFMDGWSGLFDCVIMNPPFGTKKNSGIDMSFLKTAFNMTKNSVYSLHKTSTRSYILKVAEEQGYQGTVLAELRYDLPQTFKFHKKSSLDIYVDLYRFVKK